MGLQFEGQGGDFVGGVVHQLAHKVDVGHHILPVDVLLDEEIAYGIGIAGVEGLVHGVAHGGGATAGDVDSCGAVGEEAHAEFVVYLAPYDEVVESAEGFVLLAEQVGAFVEQGVEARDAVVVGVDTSQTYDGLVVAVGEPGGLGDHLRDTLDVGVGGEGVVVDIGGMEGLAFGGFDDELGVEGAEEPFGQLADAVIDREDDDEGCGADKQANERYPRYHCHYRLLLMREEVAHRYEAFELHCLRRRLMLSM